MKNTLGDLNNHLFAQLEKLGDDDLTGEELESELKRTDAICDISEQIIKNGELQYKAMKHMDEYGYERQKAVPEMLEVHAGGGGRTINERRARRSDCRAGGECSRQNHETGYRADKSTGVR